jgi:hypothetical protein
MQGIQGMQGMQGMMSEMLGMHARIPAGIIGMREFTQEFLAAYLCTSWVCMRERESARAVARVRARVCVYIGTCALLRECSRRQSNLR